MPKNRQWYGAYVVEKIGQFTAGESVFVREIHFKEPLKVGRCYVMLNPKQGRAMRLAESVGLTSVYSMLPRDNAPEPVPEQLNDKVERYYQAWCKDNPTAQRKSPLGTKA